MGKRLSLLLSLCVASVAATILQITPPLKNGLAQHVGVPTVANPRIVDTYGKLPLSFEINQGQTDSEVKFLSRGGGYSLFLTSTEAVLALHGQSRDSNGATTKPHPKNTVESLATSPAGANASALGSESAVLWMKLVGANPSPQITGLEELPGKGNYFIGNDPSKWRTNVPTYAKVRYEGVYPGIDLVYYGNQRQLEYDFVVSPGADPSVIQLAFEGQERLAVESAGDLVLATSDGGHLRLRRPLVYQETDGLRREIAGRYALLASSQVRFQVGAYDASMPLVIDPTLVYSTYLGGGGEDVGNAIAVDSSGNAYITGATSSANFPKATPLQGTLGGLEDVFVAKLNPSGSALVYSTYLGGVGLGSAATEEIGWGIAVDSSGTAYITGETDSTNFPTVAPLQASYGGGTSDAFVARLNASGSALIFSTYLGGNGDDGAFAIALDSSGNAYVSGVTGSSTFPTTANAFQRSRDRTTVDAFITKLNPTGTNLLYSSYLGGNGYDQANGIAVDSSGNAYVTGSTESSNFPILNPLQSASGGGTCGTAPNTFPCPDAFITKLNPTGTALVYSSYLGGSGEDRAFSIAVDSSGNAYLTGFTDSANFPTASAFQAAKGAGVDAFVTKLNAAGSALVYSTYLGAGGSDRGFGIVVDSSGNAYVMGRTGSIAFPTVNPLQGRGGSFDVFVTKFNPTGSGLLFSSYLGGSGFETLDGGIAVGASGDIYVTGSTDSTNFPTASPLQSLYAGGTCGTAPNTFPCDDVFVVKISDGNPQVREGAVVNAASFRPGPVCAGSLISIFGTSLATRTGGATGLPLPTNLNGAEVRIGGVLAPLVYVSSTQINAQVPWEVSGQSLTMQVVVSGRASNTVTITLATVCGGVFTTDSSGRGQGAILIAGTGEVAAPLGSLPEGAGRAVRPGEFLSIYATGLGPVSNPPPTGSPASNPLSQLLVPVQVTIGGVPAEVTFAGLAPGFVGLYQINVKVPDGVLIGEAIQVVVTIESVTLNPITIAVQRKQVAELIVFRLGLPRGIAGGGTVSSAPPGIACGITPFACKATFSIGTEVLLTAQEDPGWTFTRWEGACRGTTCTVILQPDLQSLFGDKLVKAVFTEAPAQTFALTVSKAGTGSGTVTSSPPGINCGVTCSAAFASATSVTLTATAASGSTFAGWSGACTGTGSCTVTLDGDKTVTATFNQIPATASLTGTWVGTQQAFLTTLTQCNPITIKHTWSLTHSGTSVTGTYKKVWSTANPSSCYFLEGTTDTGSLRGTVSATSSLSIATDDGYLYSGTFTATTISIALIQGPDPKLTNPFSLTKQ